MLFLILAALLVARNLRKEEAEEERTIERKDGNRLGAWIPQRPLQFAAAGVMVLVAIALITGLLG